MAFLLDVKRRDLIINPNTAEHDVTVSGCVCCHSIPHWGSFPRTSRSACHEQTGTEFSQIWSLPSQHARGFLAAAAPDRIVRLLHLRGSDATRRTQHCPDLEKQFG